MDAQNKIQEAKLRNILNPGESAREFKITIRFREHSSDDCRVAVELARKNKYFLEEHEPNHTSYYASFYPEDVNDLYLLFQRVKELESTRIYLNDKRIPYIQELWLFLMWFYRVQ